MTERKQLEKANKAFKESIEKEIKDVKGDVNKVGRSALIGGALALAVLGISALVSSDEEKVKGKKPKKRKYKKPTKIAKDGVLLNTLKEEVILIGLSFAAQKLSEFIKELKEEKSE